MRDSSSPPAALQRVLGRFDLTAIGINQLLGATIFLIGGSLAAQAGHLALPAIAAGTVITLLFGLCLAEAGSRFRDTGGPYLVVRQAFGSFVGVQVGFMQWIVRVTSFAAIANGLLLVAGLDRGESTTARTVLLAGLVILLWLLAIAGIRAHAGTIRALAVLKLLPLLLFVAGGLLFILVSEPIAPAGALTGRDFAAAVLLVVFSLGGVEVASVPGGEARRPEADLPFAVLTSVAAVAALLFLVQIVLTHVLPDLAASQTPVADAATAMIGSAGGHVVTAAAALSILGGLSGGLLAASRLLFALAEQGDAPRVLARISARGQVPLVAISISAVVAGGLAISGSFVALATASAAARLLMYLAVACAVLRLRAHERQGGPAARFRIPGGAVIPLAALACFAATLALIAPRDLAAGGVLLLVATLVWGGTRLAVRRP